MLLTRVGWAGLHWALPFLTALVVSARYDRRKGRRHKTVTDYAQQMLVCLRRWLPDRDLVVVADGGYAKREFLRHCQSMSKPVVVVTKLRKDASLYQPPPPRRPGQIGRPRVVGARLPSPTAVRDDPATQWTPYRMDPLPRHRFRRQYHHGRADFERGAVVPRRARRAFPYVGSSSDTWRSAAGPMPCYAPTLRRNRCGYCSGICCGGRSR